MCSWEGNYNEYVYRIVDSKIVEHLQHHPVMGFLVNLYLSGLFLADSVTDRSAYLRSTFAFDKYLLTLLEIA